jgi:hypothetical protein
MGLKLFSKTKITNITLMEIKCKKLEKPLKKNDLKVQILIGLQFHEHEEESNEFESILNIWISCEEDAEKKLFSFEQSVKARYRAETQDIVTEGNFNNEIDLFLRELYNLSREDINITLNKMNIKFKLPYNFPDGILNLEEDLKKNKS